MVNKVKKWKKIVLWSLATILVLIVAAVSTLILMLQHSEGFRRNLLGKVESSLFESTGARLEVGDFKLRLSNLGLDLYNVVVHGTESDPNQPLLRVDICKWG